MNERDSHLRHAANTRHPPYQGFGSALPPSFRPAWNFTTAIAPVIFAAAIKCGTVVFDGATGLPRGPEFRITA